MATVIGDIVRKVQDELFDAYDVDSIDGAEARLSDEELADLTRDLEDYVIDVVSSLTGEYLMAVIHEENIWSDFLGENPKNLVNKAQTYFGRSNDMEDIIMAYLVDYTLFEHFGLV